jgi:hypothetical protein
VVIGTDLQKRCTRQAAASDKVYQLLAHGQWFSLGTPASSTTKTGRHDIAEIGIKHNKYRGSMNVMNSILYTTCTPILYFHERLWMDKTMCVIIFLALAVTII